MAWDQAILWGANQTSKAYVRYDPAWQELVHRATGVASLIGLPADFLENISWWLSHQLFDYVNDLFTSGLPLKAFEEAIGKHFDLALMGQAHWYLATRILQAANFNITVDQSRYSISVVKHYLEKAGCKNVTPFITHLCLQIIIQERWSYSEIAGRVQYWFASCIGSLIYLALTRTDIIYAANKLTKFTHHPGETYLLALVYLLWYLQDNTFLGLCIYSHFTTLLAYCLLKENNLLTDQVFFTFSDSSWNDDVIIGVVLDAFLSFTWAVLSIIVQIFQTLWRFLRLNRNITKVVLQEWPLHIWRCFYMRLSSRTLMKYIFVIVPRN